MSYKTKIILPGIILAGLALSGCETISAEQCHAGNWADRGYSDGVNGKSRGRLLDYVDTCSEHGASVDRYTYMQSFETGLTHYCVGEKGYQLGRSGRGYNSVCTGPQSEEFRAGYDVGYAEYRIESQYKGIVDALEDRVSAIRSVKDRLRNDELPYEEKQRLRSKLRRLEREYDDLRVDLRVFEQRYGFQNRHY